MNTITQLTGEQLSGMNTISGAFISGDMIDNLTQHLPALDSLQSQDVSSVLYGMSSLGWQFFAMVGLWILVIIWVIKDSTYRSHSTGFVILSLFLVTLGTPLL